MSGEIELYLKQQETADHCGPASIQTILSASGRVELPSQEDIGREVFVLAGDPPDTWCPPENILNFLTQRGIEAGIIQGEENNLPRLNQYLSMGNKVMVLYQDLLPDKTFPQGYPNDGNQGHWAFLLSIDSVRGLVKIGDPSRLKPGNERFINQAGVVLSEPYNNQPEYQAKLASIYWLTIADFQKSWWDNRVPPLPGRYEKAFIWIKL